MDHHGNDLQEIKIWVIQIRFKTRSPKHETLGENSKFSNNSSLIHLLCEMTIGLTFEDFCRYQNYLPSSRIATEAYAKLKKRFESARERVRERLRREFERNREESSRERARERAFRWERKKERECVWVRARWNIYIHADNNAWHICNEDKDQVLVLTDWLLRTSRFSNPNIDVTPADLEPR